MSQSFLVIAFGDSITRGENVAPHERFTAIAERQLTGRACRVINAGVNADITALALHRMQQDVLAHQPDLVTIMFGVNDAGFFRPDGPPADTPRVELGKYRSNLLEMVRAVVEVGAIPVLGTPLPMSPDYPLANLPHYQEHGLNYLVDQYADATRSVAEECDLALMDFHRAFSDDASTQAFLPDGIHPTAEGHACIAEIYTATLTSIW